MLVSKRESNGSVWCAHCGRRIPEGKGVIQIVGVSLSRFGQPRESKMLIQFEHFMRWVVSDESEITFHLPLRTGNRQPKRQPDNTSAYPHGSPHHLSNERVKCNKQDEVAVILAKVEARKHRVVVLDRRDVVCSGCEVAEVCPHADGLLIVCPIGFNQKETIPQ